MSLKGSNGDYHGKVRIVTIIALAVIIVLGSAEVTIVSVLTERNVDAETKYLAVAVAFLAVLGGLSIFWRKKDD